MKKHSAALAVFMFLAALAAEAAVRKPPVELIADCWPEAKGKGAVAARIISYSGTKAVRALVYSLTDRDGVSTEESFAIQDISGAAGPLFSGNKFYLKLAPGKSGGGSVAGLSVLFRGRNVRTRLTCEYFSTRATAARTVLAARRAAAKPLLTQHAPSTSRVKARPSS